MFSLALLTIPGFVLYTRIKKNFFLAELVAASIVLSTIFIPLAAMIARPFNIEPIIPLVIVSAFLLYYKGGELIITRKDLLAVGIACAFAALVFVVLAPFLTGSLVHPVHAGDAVWHASNAKWYLINPQFPPEDTYSPGNSIKANWLFEVLIGETNLHAVMALTAAALFLCVYLIGEKLFGTGIQAGALFMLLSGASWLVGNDFQSIIFMPLNFKFDPTLVYFFLPQPQAIGFLLAAFALYMFFEKCESLMGLALALLVGYHIQTAFVFISGITLHYIINKKKPMFLPWLILATPFVIPITQISVSHAVLKLRPEALPTISLTLLPLVVLAWKKRKVVLLPLLSAYSLLLSLVIAMPLTQNAYRFLGYASLPLTILASARMNNAPSVLLAALLCVSSFAAVNVFISSSYEQAAPSELAALDWIKNNVAKEAIILEAWSLFPRVPYLAHRRIVYGGQYGLQYHGFDNRHLVQKITNERNPAMLRQLLIENNVSYVFMGEREKTLPFASAVTQFEEPYPGVFKV